ncbi:hypothetical protein J4729_14110 [Leisingera sp. HS039]|uniref:hypothetical protein n=1 Tax=Leisingera sp. HS039 TaxID=2818496 RepID=UPI001B3A0C64|nr:hypothetical protein [Leisingera sp. HS039]MBQ4825674.1 hypothetical protein [Leisingera sp. HS039]
MKPSEFFDSVYAGAKTELALAGMTLFHGYQGKFPDLTDTSPLWCATNAEEAREYSQWGNHSGIGGTMELKLRAGQEALVGSPKVHEFMMYVGVVPHQVYAQELLSWGIERGVYLIKEHSDVYILLKPKHQCSIVGEVQFTLSVGRSPD